MSGDGFSGFFIPGDESLENGETLAETMALIVENVLV